MVNPSLSNYFTQIMEDAFDQGINSVNISCTTDHSSNKSKSAHSIKNGALALDINYINEIHVSKSNPYTEILQNVIKSNPGYKENYGPIIINKIIREKVYYAPWARKSKKGHYDHIHLSVFLNY